MSDETSLMVSPERSVDDVRRQVSKIQELMRSVMHDGEHYGTIPGTNKPSLFKPGAEKLCFVFRLAPLFEITQTDISGGHREYRIICRLKAIGTETIVGEGAGMCSTMESKYRYREHDDFQVLDQPIPKDSKEKKKEYRAQGFGMKKVDGEWCWVKYTSSSKIENPDIADTYNTVLKMASKRALVAAVLISTAASDIFTQDLEDFSAPDSAMAGPDPRIGQIYQAYQDYISSGLLPHDWVKAMQDAMDAGEVDIPKLEKRLAAVRKRYDQAMAAQGNKQE